MRPLLLEPGARFGRLIVLRRAPSKHHRLRFVVRCECGTRRVVFGLYLRNGHTRSCGCLRDEKNRVRFLTHGHAIRQTPEYRAWVGMIRRCTDPSRKDWPYYGGRGIRVCRRWRHSFAAFLADVGLKPAPDLTLDRIENNQHYKPGNVRWATRSTQSSNQRKRRPDCTRKSRKRIA